jgi:hypothetical protein
MSAPSGILEPQYPIKELLSAPFYWAPGLPIALVMGFHAAAYFDKRYSGRAKEVCTLDPQGRLCFEVEVSGIPGDITAGGPIATFASPVFPTATNPRAALAHRRAT